MANDKQTYNVKTGYDNLIGSQVKIIFTDGTALSGKLVRRLQYELLLEKEKGESSYQVAVAKAAVKYVAPIELFKK